MKTIILAFVASVFLLECQGTQPISGYKPIRELKNDAGFRLPSIAVPNSYDLTLQFNDNGSLFTASGEVTINLNVTDANDDHLLYLNSKVNFDANPNATWTNQNANFSCPIDTSQAEYIILNCTQSIKGTNQRVTIPFIPTVSTDSMKGAYVAQFYEDGKKKYIVATQFEQDWARAVFPSFDEPQYKAPITLTLKTPKTSTYIENERMANTEIQNASTTEEFYITTFEPTPNMSTYLLAFIITEDFKSFSNTDEQHNYTFTVFARKSAESYVNTALTNGPVLVDNMGTFTKIPYEQLGNRKLTLAAVPEFAAGAMENWGLITFRETYLIDEGEKTSRKDVQAITEVIAHELAHQWFGNYVTLDWWSDTWLNEGFAEYFEYYLTDQVLEKAEMWQQFVIKEQQPALKVDAYPDSIPLSNNASNVTTESDFSTEFGTISYSKGASIIKMLNYTMGKEDFKQGLRKYLKNHNYQNATAADLIDSLQLKESNSLLNLSEYFNEWIYKAGYPVLEVSLNTTDNKTVNIHPKRFSSSLDKSGENNSSIWWIPLTYATVTDNAENITWLPPGENHTIKINSSDWILVNLKSLGFYRVNYDETLWNRLIDALKSESLGKIDVINRAQLLDDVFNIARSYEGDEQQQRKYYLRAFKLADYLVNETEYHPWYTFFVEVQYLLDRIQDEDTLTELKEKVLDLVSKQADVAINATLEDTQTHIQVLKNDLLLNWACKVGHKGCVKWALDNFQTYVTNKSIDNNYRDVILCTGLANSNNDTEFNLILKQLNESSLPLEQNELAKSLGCIKNTTYVSLAIEATLNETNIFSRMMYPTILNSLISNGKENLIETINSVKNNDLSINKKWKAVSSTESILASIASKCYSNDCITSIEEYIKTNENDINRTSIVKAAKQALATVQTNLKWVEKYEETLISVIKYGGGDNPTTASPPESTTASGEKVGFSIILGCTVILLANLI